MKKSVLLSGLSVCLILMLSFREVRSGSIEGKVTPAWYAVRAWAISETDTLYTCVADGNFQFSNAQPGTYRVIIEARSPYRHMVKENIVVTEEVANIGELSLKKWQ